MSSQRAKKTIIAEIEELTRHQGFVYVFCALVYDHLFVNQKEITEINWYERLSVQELSFLGGLMLKHPLSLEFPSEPNAMQDVRHLEELFEELHRAFNRPTTEKMSRHIQKGFRPADQADGDFRDILSAGDFMAEAIFYSGSDAYDFQYHALAEHRYKQDQDWFVRKHGFGIQTVCDVTRELKNLLSDKVRNINAQKSDGFEKRCRSAFDALCFDISELTSINSVDAEAVLSAFSTDPADPAFGCLRIPGDFNAFEARPIVRIYPGRFFLPIIFNLSQSIYESPFYWMLADLSYKDTGMKNRGNTTADIAESFLKKVFGETRVFKNVNIVRAKGKTVSDIDVLAFAGNKAIVLQAKSKRLTDLSRKGDEARLKEDFSKAVQEAYEQGLACRRAILSKDHFLETESGLVVEIDSEIDDVYLICVTSDRYPSLLHQVEMYLTRDPLDPYPIALSLFDFEVLTEYLSDPFEFLYYIRQRIVTAGHFGADNEVGLLAYHLNQRLWLPPGTDYVAIDGSFAQLIDADFPKHRGEQPNIQGAGNLRHKWLNPDFNALLAQIKSSNVPGLTDAIFLLYEISSQTADEIVRLIGGCKQKSANGGKNPNFSMTFGKSMGLSFVCRHDEDGLPDAAAAFAMIKKYQLKAAIWIGLGSVAGSENMIDFVCFNRSPWEYDIDLENAGYKLRRATVMEPGNKIGRNEPCRCGSGLKSKKCCSK